MDEKKGNKIKTNQLEGSEPQEKKKHTCVYVVFFDGFRAISQQPRGDVD